MAVKGTNLRLSEVNLIGVNKGRHFTYHVSDR